MHAKLAKENESRVQLSQSCRSHLGSWWNISFVDGVWTSIPHAVADIEFFRCPNYTLRCQMNININQNNDFLRLFERSITSSCSIINEFIPKIAPICCHLVLSCNSSGSNGLRSSDLLLDVVNGKLSKYFWYHHCRNWCHGLVLEFWVKMTHFLNLTLKTGSFSNYCSKWPLWCHVGAISLKNIFFCHYSESRSWEMWFHFCTKAAVRKHDFIFVLKPQLANVASFLH